MNIYASYIDKLKKKIDVQFVTYIIMIALVISVIYFAFRVMPFCNIPDILLQSNI